MRKLEKAKNVLAELEDEVDAELSGARFSLRQAGQTIDIENTFVSHLQEAMGEVAGFAIEAGLDDIASDATEVIVELEQNESDDD
ncbi:hypothetical protein B4589_004400 [Halolamina sp. CBA1230]|jgi:hypothetical protein|uniref:hypothetical protein n=1 Tax=Halolamina sp. CBA1230 TaxID=1853690 RepID=UPI0009A1C569|nr:hypothetical protein [Halolamina sp. CBA1230]QKY19656.1 hypothetical protein B4589_004400 [Halolamina sp. CBA1230]